MPSPNLDHVFAALADPTRRAILRRLEAGEATISTLAEPFAMSLPGLSKHVRVLEEAGLVRRRVVGRTHWISLDPGPLRAASDWIAHYRRFWESSLDRLDQLLTTEQESAQTVKD